MPGTENWREAPKKIYFVIRVPPESEREPYYGRVKSRMYQSMQGVNQFKNAWPGSKFLIWTAEPEWSEQND